MGTGFLKILSPGAHTTVQDLGRTGCLEIGIPGSGALDPVSVRLANALVGNADGAACLEVLYHGPELEVEAECVCLSLMGQGVQLDISGDESMTCLPGQSVVLGRGARIRFSPLRGDAVAYLAVAGGFELPSFAGSLSTYARGGFGGFEGRALLEGDRLPLVGYEGADLKPMRIGGEIASINPAEQIIRVVMGPQDDFFSNENLETFLSADFQISASSDRMGARLDGPLVKPQNFEGFISDGITNGAIQVPGSGQLIILLADHQTSGGYPKIATVISSDLPLLGRARPGQILRFEAVTVHQAEEIRRNLERDIQRLKRSIRPLAANNLVDPSRLYDHNLISGMVSGEI